MPNDAVQCRPLLAGEPAATLGAAGMHANDTDALLLVGITSQGLSDACEIPLTARREESVTMARA